MTTPNQRKKKEALDLVAISIRRALQKTPIDPEMRAEMAVTLRKTFDANSIYELAAIKTLEAEEFKSALIVLAVLKADNESILRELSSIQADQAELFRDELSERAAELRALHNAASERGRRAVNARHDQANGYREKKLQVQQAWQSGKFKTKMACAMAVQQPLGISVSTALKALRTPRGKRASTP